MKIGITYDTKEDYENIDYSKYCDFASLISISFLKKQFEQAGFEVKLIGTYDNLNKLIQSGELVLIVYRIPIILANHSILKGVPMALKIVYKICCGIDVHKTFVVTCIASTVYGKS